MRRFLISALVIAAVVAVAPVAASGAKPEHGFHTESSTDPDSCGTGASVDEFFESIFTTSERNGVIKTEHQGSTTFTYGDASVVVSFAGQFTDTIVATEEGGVEIHRLVSKGITEKIQLPHGPVLLLDRGVLVELVTVQDGNVLDAQIVSMNGPHPDRAGHGSLFCQIVPQALGIT
jgi:hypothetical protein